jgi:hypothetical protein
VSNSLAGGHAGEWPHRHDPRDQLRLSYAFQPPDPDRIARAYPPRDRCAWSPEIIRERAREAERCRQVLATIDAAEARLEARALYRAQRRQALTAILYGVVIMILVIAAAGG